MERMDQPRRPDMEEGADREERKPDMDPKGGERDRGWQDPGQTGQRDREPDTGERDMPGGGDKDDKAGQPK